VLFTNSLTNGHMKTNAALSIVPRAMVDAFETATQRLPGALRRRVCVQLAARLRRPA
jgi:hypothetical protein